MNNVISLVFFWMLASGVAFAGEAAQTLELTLRRQHATSPDAGPAPASKQVVHWDAQKTAIIICDMWDQHWCKGASERVAELAPRMNEVIQKARKQGVLIIHAPSGTMKFYEGTPQRQRALQAPKVTPPIPLDGWCSLTPGKEGPLPIDDSDGGCDCVPQCPQGGPWKRQIATLEIGPQDAITDSGGEVYNLLQQYGIENVILMGVHANMCVLGRPFAIRQMVALGKHVVLMRDMTDTMYNSRQRPFVSHFRGTDLVVEHIEKYWCPTITSTDLTGRPAFHFQKDKRPKVALVIGEQEYDAKTTLPAFAESELAYRYGFQPMVIQSDATNSLPGLEQLAQVDLAIFYLRRRSLPEDQMALIHRYLESGKAVVALRTSSHAFQNWLAFDGTVLGGHYAGHYGDTKEAAAYVSPRPECVGHPILQGIPRDEFPVASTLYKTSPLAATATPLMMGRAGDRQPSEPVAWVNSYHGARVFYTSLGHAQDFKLEPFRHLLRNGIFWALDLPVPTN